MNRMNGYARALGVGLCAWGMAAADAAAQGQWVRQDVTLTSPRSFASVDAIASVVQVVGGGTNGSAEGRVEVLSIAGDRITGVRQLPNLQGELRLAGDSAACGRLIFQEGGFENRTMTRLANETLSAGDTVVNTVRATSFLEEPLHRAFNVVEAVDTRVFVIGGTAQGNNPTQRVETIDCDTINLNASGGNRGARAGDDFEDVAQIPNPVVNGGGATLDGRVVVVGGSATAFTGPAQNLTQIYDPENDTWSMGAPMPTPRVGVRAAPISDTELVAIGGSDGDRVLDTVEIYNIETNEWRAATSFPAPTTNGGAARIGDGLVVYVGGSSSANRAMGDRDTVFVFDNR